MKYDYSELVNKFNKWVEDTTQSGMSKSIAPFNIFIAGYEMAREDIEKEGKSNNDIKN